MKKSALPKVSIIILNYNGELVISTTIDSVYKSTYPKNAFEVIVVDNNSQDKSAHVLKTLKKKYPQLHLILSKENAGFSGGNNLGYEAATGDYVILLNNDVIVDKDWITHLVYAAESDPRICAVNSKIQLFPYFFPLSIYTDVYYQDMHITLDKGELQHYTKRKISVFHTYDNNQYYSIHVPLSPVKKERIVSLTVHIYTQHTHKAADHFKIQNHPAVQKATYTSKENLVIISIKIDCSKIKPSDVFTKIQNAGIVMFDNGSGRDIGAVVRYYAQDYERDLGQYDQPKEVYAACGAAVLYRKSVFDEIGFLSRDFFMYYEDVDLAERARLQGYKIVYEPKAAVRHMHALSSEEWSPFFTYHAEKGRLVHMAHHFPLRVFLYEWYMFSFVACSRLLSHYNKRRHWIRDIQYIKAAGSVFYNIPNYIRYRQKYTTPQSIRELYTSLQDGEWLLT